VVAIIQNVQPELRRFNEYRFLYTATERCYNLNPYGRRYAVNTLERHVGKYPLLPVPGGLPLFECEDQEALDSALNKVRRKCDFQMNHLKRQTTPKLKGAGSKTGRIHLDTTETSHEA
jgi:hypothetical protein